MVRELEIKSEDLGFDRLAGQGEGQLFYPHESTLVQRWLCLNPLPVYDTHPALMCVHVKDPVSICCKSVGLTAVGMETQKHRTQEKNKKLGSAAL